MQEQKWHLLTRKMRWCFYGIPLLALALSLIAIQVRQLSAQAAPVSENLAKLVQLSQDPYTNTGDALGGPVYHQTGYEPASYSSGSTIVSTFQVGRFEGGSTNLGWATSLDAGKHWHTGLLPGTTVFAGGSHDAISNASVAYDPKHNVWLLSYLFVDHITTSGVVHEYGSATAVSRSFDGGLTWSAPTIVSTAPAGDDAYDKPWMTCDTSAHSPFYGYCYMLWNNVPRSISVLQQMAAQPGALSSIQPPRSMA